MKRVGSFGAFKRAMLSASIVAIASVSSAYAEYELGLEAFRSGDKQLALDLWERYAVAGDVQSMKALGDYWDDEDIPGIQSAGGQPSEETNIDYIKALKWYTLAAYHDFNESLRVPSVFERNAQIEAEEALPRLRQKMSDAQVAEAEKLVSETFERGTARDIFIIGRMYQRGAGVKKNNIRAYQLYAVAGDNGVKEATDALLEMRNLGLIDKKGIEKAEKLAASWQPPLPEKHTGDTSQMKELRRLKAELEAIRLEDALNEVRDIDVRVLQHALKALGFYFGDIDDRMGPQTREAVRRFQYAQVRNDRMMTAEEKRNVEVGVLSAKDTVELIRQAADRADNEVAQYTYGIMYLRGIGVQADGDLAVNWLRKSATRNIAEAHYALGVIFRDGTTGLNAVSADKAQAALHFAKAGQLGYVPATKALQLLEFEGQGQAGQ
ncbi:MAG: peptidoglycan-binding protein [Pseudomonadota bacterium]